LHLPPIFGPALFDGVIQIFNLLTHVAMATNFGTKLTKVRLPQNIIARCFHLPPIFSGPGYAMMSRKFLPWRPLLSWKPTVFIQRQNWLQAQKSVKRWNEAVRLYSVAMGQIPRSTERISSSKCLRFVSWLSMVFA